MQNGSFDGGNRKNAFYGEDRITVLSHKARDAIKNAGDVLKGQFNQKSIQRSRCHAFDSKSTLLKNLLLISCMGENYQLLFNHLMESHHTIFKFMHNFVEALQVHPDHLEQIGDVNRGEVSAERVVKILEKFALDQGDSRVVTQYEGETFLTSKIPDELLLFIYTVEVMMAMTLNLRHCKQVVNNLKDMEKEESVDDVVFHNFTEKPIFPTISTFEWIVSLDIYLKDILKEKSLGRDFLTTLYHPEYFDWKFGGLKVTLPFTYTIDPDHVKKRLVTAMSSAGGSSSNTGESSVKRIPI